MVNLEAYHQIVQELQATQTQLVAVSKLKSTQDIQKLYEAGQRDFGENYVQELVEKQAQLPADIRWHFIGHLQSNKVKYIAPFVHLIHGVDSLKLLQEINKQARKNNRVIDVLLQVHIATEETKFGLDEGELDEILGSNEIGTLQHVRINGLMGMASFSDNEQLVRSELKKLKHLFDKHFYHQPSVSQLPIPNSELPTPDSSKSTLSMGMSGDYKWAIEEGSNMVRIGSLLFGHR